MKDRRSTEKHLLSGKKKKPDGSGDEKENHFKMRKDAWFPLPLRRSRRARRPRRLRGILAFVCHRGEVPRAPARVRRRRNYGKSRRETQSALRNWIFEIEMNFRKNRWDR